MDTLSFMTIFLIASVCYVHGNVPGSVNRIGNEISKPSLSGVDVPATFLQKDIILTEGVLFAYSAFYRSDKVVWFQIWRPVTGAGVEEDTYTLVAQTRVLPAVIGRREDTYIESRLSTEKCFRVKQNDRLGVYLEQSPGAVSYIFDSNSPTALNHRLENGTTSYTQGDEYKFDSLVFPYDFAVAAYIDIDPDHYANTDPATDFVDCYPGVLIPDYIDPGVLTTTTVPITGAPGATGLQGPMGAPGLQGPTGEPGATGAQGEVGATGPRGVNGVAGVDGKDGTRGPQGVEGAVGATGSQGAKGEKGDMGPVGLTGKPGKIIYVTNGSDILPLRPAEEGPSSIFSTDMMSMSYLIWLIVLTVIIIILIIVIIVISRRRLSREGSVDDFGRTRLPSTNSSRTRFPSLPSSDLERDNLGYEKGSSNQGFERGNSNQEFERGNSTVIEKGWMDTMKGETETTYSNDTLERDQDYSNGGSMPNMTFEDETKASELGY